MVPLIITTDSSGNSRILIDKEYGNPLVTKLIQLHKLSILLINFHVCWLSVGYMYFAPATAAIVPALITVNVVTVTSLVVAIVFIVWCFVIKIRKIKSKLKQQ